MEKQEVDELTRLSCTASPNMPLVRTGDQSPTLLSANRTLAGREKRTVREGGGPPAGQRICVEGIRGVWWGKQAYRVNE